MFKVVFIAPKSSHGDRDTEQHEQKKHDSMWTKGRCTLYFFLLFCLLFVFMFANVLWLIRLLLITSAVSSCSEKCVDLCFCVLHPRPESAKMGGHNQYTLWNAIESDVWPVDSHSQMYKQRVIFCLINVHPDLWIFSMAYLTFVVSVFGCCIV